MTYTKIRNPIYELFEVVRYKNYLAQTNVKLLLT